MIINVLHDPRFVVQMVHNKSYNGSKQYDTNVDILFLLPRFVNGRKQLFEHHYKRRVESLKCVKKMVLNMQTFKKS